MKKIISIFSIVVFISFSAFSQKKRLEATNQMRVFAKGGLGTSWLTFPKVFLVDPDNLNNIWEISPARNNFTFFIGAQGVIPLGRHWVFAPEVSYNYLSGMVKIDRLENPQEAIKLQSYSRIAVPLNFGVVSSDNFWFEFGPIVYFMVADNKGFDRGVNELTQNAQVNSDEPIGLAMRLGAVARLSPSLFLEAKFEYDVDRKFEYNNGIYDVRIAMQGVTIGLGYALTGPVN